MWNYTVPDEETFRKKMLDINQMFGKLGAEPVDRYQVHQEQYNKNGLVFENEIKMTIWQHGSSYYRVGEIHFPKKPFFVIECADSLHEPFEDADPFPYDLSDAEIEKEILTLWNDEI